MVSIIIPIYNVAAYIEKCLTSVINQTYKDLEVLLVDDCGKDNSMDIANRIINEYEGPITFQIIHHDHNRGLSAARNSGIEASHGEWLYFLDSDDWIIPECISLLVDCIRCNPLSEMCVAGAKATKDFEWMDFTIKDLPSYSEDRVWINSAILRRNLLSMTAWNKLIRKDFVVKHNLYFVEGAVNEDEMWNFMLSKHLTALSICKTNTYNYLVRDNSIVSDKEKMFANKIVILNYWLDNMGGPFIKQETTSIFYFLLSTLADQRAKKYKREFNIIKHRLVFKSKKRQFLYLFSYFYLPLFIKKKWNIDERIELLVDRYKYKFSE